MEADEDLRLPFFPPPPPYFAHFTAENLERLQDVKKDAGVDSANDTTFTAGLTPEQILALPAELRFMVPPEPPADNEDFKVFGEVARAEGAESFAKNMEWISRELSTSATITGWQYEQLYDSTSSSQTSTATLDRQRYLFRFNRSLIIAYVELLGIIAVNPTADQKEERLKDILTMVTNMHALINEYRPHQARETLIREMERQVERKKSEIEGVKKMKARVQEALDGFGGAANGGSEEQEGGQAKITLEEDGRREMQRQMWTTLDEVLG